MIEPMAKRTRVWVMNGLRLCETENQNVARQPWLGLAAEYGAADPLFLQRRGPLTIL